VKMETAAVMVGGRHGGSRTLLHGSGKGMHGMDNVEDMEDMENMQEKFAGLYAHEDTINCVVENQCIPCLYKLFPDGSKGLGSSVGAFPPNVRPEQCPRHAKMDSAAPSSSSSSKASSFCGLYDHKRRILTVGDGDFSFSLSLMENIRSRKATRLIATSYESYESIQKTYATGIANIAQLREKHGVSVLNDVDATNLVAATDLSDKQFDIIVWNFPCVGLRNAKTEDGQVKEIDQNKQMLRDFFLNCKPFLKLDGYNEIHVNHKTCEPFSWWKIEEIAADCGFSLAGRFVFDRLQLVFVRVFSDTIIS
jgi:25S rRNA (uracil2634-N3)-methyltransferase